MHKFKLLIFSFLIFVMTFGTYSLVDAAETKLPEADGYTEFCFFSQGKYSNISHSHHTSGLNFTRTTAFGGVTSKQSIFMTYSEKREDFAYYNFGMLRLTLPDPENYAISLYYKHLGTTDKLRIGLRCYGIEADANNDVTDSGYIYLNISDVPGFDKTKTGWQKIVIPFNYLKEYGTFDGDLFSNSITEFNWKRIRDIAFVLPTDGMTVGTGIGAFDDIKITEYIDKPQNFKNSTTQSGCLVSFDPPAGSVCEITGYDIYRETISMSKKVLTAGEGYFLEKDNNLAHFETLDASKTHFSDTKLSDDKMYVYYIQTLGERDGTLYRSIPAVEIVSVFDSSAQITTDTALTSPKDVFIVTNEAVSTVVWDCDDTPDRYYITKNGSFCGKTTTNYYIDKNYSAGDVYTVSAFYSHSNKLSDAITAQNRSIETKLVIDSYKFTDTSGNEVSVSGNSDDIKNCVINTSNFTGNPTGAKVIVAVYENSTLNEVYSFTKEIQPGETEFSLPVNLRTLTPTEYKLKLMMWDGFGNLIPIADAKENVYPANATELNKYEINVTDETRQTMRAFGFSPTLNFISTADGFDNSFGFKNHQALADVLIKESGISMARHFVKSESMNFDGSINHEIFKDVTDFIDYITKNGLETYMLTFTGPRLDWCLIDPEETNPSLDFIFLEEYEDVYCRAMVNQMIYLRDNGYTMPVAISPYNEPTNGNIHPLLFHEQYSRIVITLRNKLDEAGFDDLPIIGFETANYTGLQQITGRSQSSDTSFSFSQVEKIPGYKDAVDIVGVHSYGSSGQKPGDIALFANSFPEKERWMTETSFDDITGEGIDNSNRNVEALKKQMQVFAGDVQWGRHNVWLYWLGTYYAIVPSQNDVPVYIDRNNERVYQSLVFATPGSNRIYRSNLYYALSTIFRNVKPGSVVKGVETTCPTLVNESGYRADIAAFEHENGSLVMLVNDSDNDMTMNFSGLKGEIASAYSVRDSREGITKLCTKTVTNSNISEVFVPANSVVFVVSGTDNTLKSVDW